MSEREMLLSIMSRFDAMEAKLEVKFEAIDRRFDVMEGRMDAVEWRLDKIEGRLHVVEGHLSNIAADLDKIEKWTGYRADPNLPKLTVKSKK
ncbi:MAG TPA: hypothetical protein VGE90_04560 [Chitinophaga sp.]